MKAARQIRPGASSVFAPTCQPPCHACMSPQCTCVVHFMQMWEVRVQKGLTAVLRVAKTTTSARDSASPTRNFLPCRPFSSFASALLSWLAGPDEATANRRTDSSHSSHSSTARLSLSPAGNSPLPPSADNRRWLKHWCTSWPDCIALVV
jgi:hypothetical protein